MNHSALRSVVPRCRLRRRSSKPTQTTVSPPAETHKSRRIRRRPKEHFDSSAHQPRDGSHPSRACARCGPNLLRWVERFTTENGSDSGPVIRRRCNAKSANRVNVDWRSGLDFASEEGPILSSTRNSSMCLADVCCEAESPHTHARLLTHRCLEIQCDRRSFLVPYASTGVDRQVTCSHETVGSSTSLHVQITSILLRLQIASNSCCFFKVTLRS